MKRLGSQRGLALVSALLIVTLAGILAAGRMFQLQLESQASKALIGTARARMIALEWKTWHRNCCLPMPWTAIRIIPVRPGRAPLAR